MERFGHAFNGMNEVAQADAAKIAAAESFDVLYRLLYDEIGPITGSQQRYSPKKLYELIEEVRRGSKDITFITSAYGLRDKVESLLQEHSVPGNALPPDEDPPSHFEAAVAKALPDLRWLNDPESYNDFYQGLKLAGGLMVGDRFQSPEEIRDIMDEVIMGRLEPQNLPIELRPAGIAIRWSMHSEEQQSPQMKRKAMFSLPKKTDETVTYDRNPPRYFSR